MLDRLKALFLADAETDADRPTRADDELRLAAVALLVEAACADGAFDAAERQCIRGLIESRFGLTSQEAAALLEEATKVVEDSVQILRFTRAIKDRYSYAERVALIEMLWDVIFVDGASDALEAQLMRRIGGLLYVSDHDRGAARQRVLARRKHGDPPPSPEGEVDPGNACAPLDPMLTEMRAAKAAKNRTG